MATTERLRALNDVLRYARRAPFYKQRLPGTPLGSWEELARLPLTTRGDLVAHGPLGLVAAPLRDLLQYHESTGTTGAPVSVWYAREDLAEIVARLAEWGAAMSPDDRVLVRFPYALSTIGHFVHGAAQACGACVIPADSRSSITPLPRVVDLMRRLDVTVLATISMSALMLAETAEGMGLAPRRDFPSLRAIVCAGEPVGPARRALVEETWGVPLFDNHGMTESGPLAMDCAHRRLHPFDDVFWMEILDDELRRPVPRGEVGRLVITSLSRRATPLVRYVTGDRAARLPERCGCGERTRLEVRGRAEDTLTVNGRLVDVGVLSDIVARLPSRRFFRASAPEGALRIVVERERDADTIAVSLVRELEREHGIPLEISLVPRGTLYDRREPVSFGMKGKPVYLEGSGH